MQTTLIHYGPFKRNASLDSMIGEQIESIKEHYSSRGDQKFQVWLDRTKSRDGRHGFSYSCKIVIHPEHGRHIFVEKKDSNLFGAINKARRAALNLLDHTDLKRDRRIKKARKLFSRWNSSSGIVQSKQSGAV